MADKSVPKINANLNNQKLTAYQVQFMKIIEQQNAVRVEKLRIVRRNNRLTGVILGSIVLGIYGYSMHAVRQETFLDDFESPQKTIG